MFYLLFSVCEWVCILKKHDKWVQADAEDGIKRYNRYKIGKILRA